MTHSSRVWKSKIGGGRGAVCQHGRVRTLLWVPDMSLCPHMDEETGSLWGLLHKDTKPVGEGPHLHDLSTSQDPAYQCHQLWGLGFQHMSLGATSIQPTAIIKLL